MSKRNRNRAIRDASLPPKVQSTLAEAAVPTAKKPVVRRFEPNPKHGASARGTSMGVSSRGPTNGQAALDRSVQVKPSNPRRRVGADHENGEVVVLDRHHVVETDTGVVEYYHGHVRPWGDTSRDGLNPDMRNALQRNGLVDRKGNPTPPPG